MKLPKYSCPCLLDSGRVILSLKSCIVSPTAQTQVPKTEEVDAEVITGACLFAFPTGEPLNTIPLPLL